MRRDLLLTHISFVLTGIVTTLLGPILPMLAQRWSLPDARSGSFFIAQFVGSFAGAMLSSRLLTAFGSQRTMSLGMLLTAAGVAGTSIGSPVSAMAGIACYGLGLGFAIPAGNMFAAEMSPANKAAALNLLNFSWTVGAIVAPLGIAVLIRHAKLGGLLVALAAVIAFAALLLSIGSAAKNKIVTKEPLLSNLPAISFALVIGLFLFLYVGVENGLAGWLPSYSTRVHSLSPALAAILQSTFWGALLLGRLLSPLPLSRIAPTRVVSGGLWCSLVALGIVLSAPNSGVLLAGVCLAGLGFSVLFPTTVAIFHDRFGDDAGRRANIVFSAAALGGAFVPPVIGFLSSRTHSLRAGMVVLLFCLAAMMWAQRRMTLSRGETAARAAAQF